MGRDRSRSMSSSSSGRGIQSSSWDGQSGYRIHVSDLAAGIKRKEVERAFTKFGPINEVWVATNPPCFAFINFKHRSDAEQAIRDIDGKQVGNTRVGVTWARTRTYGSRNVGGRSGPYGSFRPSGSSRRRSKSRSRSGSRNRKRRHSRSRSRDRHRRRSESPRDRKRSRRSSKSKREPSASPSRSRSRSASRKKSSKNGTKPSRSPSTHRDEKANGSPVTDGRSPLAANDE